MTKAILATVVSAGLLAGPTIVGSAYGQTQTHNQKSTKKVARNRSRGSGRRRARNTAIGGAGGAAAGALIGGGRGARTGAIVGGGAGALRPTGRRRR